MTGAPVGLARAEGKGEQAASNLKQAGEKVKDAFR
jgi:hypothetical protein